MREYYNFKAQCELLKEIRIKKKKYFDHIKRHNNKLKTLLKGKVQGTKGAKDR